MKFRSCDQAIRFAYRVRGRPEFAKTDPASVPGGGSGMSPLELHGESALILAKMEALPPVERDSLVAMYGDVGERAEAVARLVSHLMPLVASSLPNKEAVQVMLLHWSTRTPSVRVIAKELGVSYREVCKWRSVVAGAWTPVVARATDRLDQALFGPGGFERATC